MLWLPDLEMNIVQMKGEPEICKSFGCGKHLTLEEIRFGDKCREHSIKKETDILNVIKLK